MVVEKKRDSNLELYRILLMIAIIAHHYVVNSGLFDVLSSEPASIKSLSFYWLGMWGKTGINCFVLITGYFMCKSQITLKKFLKLLFEIEFYIILIFCFFKAIGYGQLTIIDLIKQQLLYLSINDGFVSCFLFFYLLIPFLNILVKGLNQKLHLLLIGLCLFIFTILGTIPKVDVVMNYVEWFCVLYLVASYIRIYGFPVALSTIQWGGVSFLAIVVSMISVAALKIYMPKMYQYYFVSDSNHIMAFLVAVCLFMFFKSIRIPYCKWINIIAESIFGVLLIHANSDTMRQWLWKDTISVVEHYRLDGAIGYAIASILLVFAVCVVIDQLRLRMIEKPLFYFLEKRNFLKKKS